jgi:hypothetical protein
MTTPDLEKLAEAWERTAAELIADHCAAAMALAKRDRLIDSDAAWFATDAWVAADDEFNKLETAFRDNLRTALSTLTEALSEAAFLLARLSEIDWSGDIDSLAREYNGHVEPSIERLRALTVGDRDKGGES